MRERQWESYEEVAAYLLNQFAEDFGLGAFEGKQVVAGQSGTEWEIDAKGCSADGSHFVVVECKRHTKAGISQAITAGLAWSIQDTGGSSGILVSPIGLQDGAKKVAASARIHEVILNQDSTKTDYVLKFLNKICVGVSETVRVGVSERLVIQVKNRDGDVIETRRVDSDK